MKFSFPGILTIVVLLIFGAFYAFDPGFRQWLFEAYSVFKSGEISTIRQFLNDYRDVGYLILLGAFLFQMFLFVLPSVTVMILSVLMYGPVEGALLSIAGISVAATVAYFLGKVLSTAVLDRLIGEESRKKMTRFLNSYGFATVVVFRISPFFSNDAVSFVAGLVKMNYLRFISATVLGITPLAVLIGYFGRSIESMDTGLVIASIVGLMGLVLYIYVDKKKLGN